MSSARWQDRFRAAEHPSGVMALVDAYVQSLSPDDLGAMPKEAVQAMLVGHIQHAAEVLQRSAREFRGNPRIGEKISLAANVFAGANLRLAELRSKPSPHYLEWREKVRTAPNPGAVRTLVNAYVEAIPLYDRLRLPHAGWQALAKCTDVAEAAGTLREATASFRGEPEIASLLGECSFVFEAGASRLAELR